MNKPELVLSNTTSFFSGKIESLFKNAKKYGFKYVEVVPYRGNTPRQILNLQKQYAVTVAGVHLPNTSWDSSVWPEIKQAEGLWEKIWTAVFHAYLGNVEQNPGIQITSALENPYLLIHSNVAAQMGDKFNRLSRQFHVVVENVPGDTALFPGGIFDHGHFNETRQDFPNLNLLALYEQAKPEIIHISYNSRFIHLLPNHKEQAELKQLLKVHQPKYMILETNPLVSIKKGKALLDKIIAEALG